MKLSKLGVALGTTALLWGAQAPAVEPLIKCLQARQIAAAKYAACQQKAFGAYWHNTSIQKFAFANGKCTAQYAATWIKLQKIGVAPCTGSRFVDQGNGTVIDNLTTLVWEQKRNLNGTPSISDVHDADNSYAWTLSGTAADGSAFTTFLTSLNTSPGCFAGQCDWRLPSASELETIRAVSASKPYACLIAPCLDATLGPTAGITMWASTESVNPELVWVMFPGSGEISPASKLANGLVARAVRGGL